MPVCGCYSRWLALCAALQARVGAGLGRIGYLSAKRPCSAIGFCVLVSLLCSPGFLRFETETSSGKLWVQQDSDATLRQVYIDETWGSEPSLLRFLVQARDTGQNALTLDAFSEAFGIVDTVLAIESDGVTYSDICWRSAAGNCQGLGALRFFDFNRTMFEAQVSTNAELLAALSSDAYPDSQPVYRDEVFAGSVTSGSQIASAAVWRFDFLVESRPPGASKWQKRVIDRFVSDDYAEVVQEWQHIHVELFSPSRSTDDELGRSVSGDITFMIYAYIFLVMSCALLLGPPLKCVGGRRLLGALEFLLVLLASVAGYGLASALGVPFTSLQQILPFILVGVGVDDAYVIAGALDRTDRGMPVEERVREALEAVGMSVTLTSATSILCFLVGSVAAFPAVSHFCVYAGLSLTFIYAFHMTAFCAMLSVDARRQQAGRLDVLCCIRARTGDVVGFSGETESFGERVMAKYTRAITSHISVKFVVVCSFLCSAGLFLWQAIEKTDTSFSVSSLAPDDSYMRKFLATENEYWGGDTLTLDVKVGLYFRDLEESDAATQAQMMKAENALLAVSCISEQKGVVSWHRRFSDWVRANKHSPVHGLWTADDFQNIDGHEFLSGPRFYAALEYWLSDCTLGCSFKNDFIFKDGGIQDSRVWVMQKNIPGSDDQVNCLDEVEAFSEDASTVLPGTFASTRVHIYYHTYRVIRRELFTTICICFVSVLVVSSTIISHPTAVAIVFVVLVLVFVHLVGALPVAGVPLNSISMVNLVMAIGLVIDYSMHIAHSFMMQDPKLSRNERTERAMKEIGLAVFLGIFSTFVAILPLAFASSEVFRVFFKMFVAISIAGGSHGLILMPVVLSLVGPSTIHGAACKTQAENADEPEMVAPRSYADELEVATTS